MIIPCCLWGHNDSDSESCNATCLLLASNCTALPDWDVDRDTRPWWWWRWSGSTWHVVSVVGAFSVLTLVLVLLSLAIGCRSAPSGYCNRQTVNKLQMKQSSATKWKTLSYYVNLRNISRLSACPKRMLSIKLNDKQWWLVEHENQRNSYG